MLSHPHPRAHLSPVLLIPAVVASASLTLTQHAATALIPGLHSLHRSFSGLEPLNLSTLHLASQHTLVALLNMNLEPVSFFSYTASQMMPSSNPFLFGAKNTNYNMSISIKKPIVVINVSVDTDGALHLVMKEPVVDF